MMETRNDVYLENVDQLLILVNNAKEQGYNFNFEEVALIVDFDLNNMDKMDILDLEITLSVNKAYVNNTKVFVARLENYLKSKVI